MRLSIILLLSALAACKPTYRAFESGDVVHHRSNNAPAVVRSCEGVLCWVSDGKGTHVWWIFEIVEKAKTPPQ